MLACFASLLRLFQIRAPLNSKHVFGTTLAMRQNKQAHFWLTSTNDDGECGGEVAVLTPSTGIEARGGGELELPRYGVVPFKS